MTLAERRKMIAQDDAMLNHPDSQKETPVKFLGKDYILYGTLEIGGSIATRKQFENFLPSFAHLYPNGVIMRNGAQIGTREDLILRDDKV